MMIKWIAKIHWGKVLLSGLLYLVVATIIQQIEVALTMQYYVSPQYAGLWSKLMMPASPAGGPTAGPPPMEFFITSTVMTFATGVSLAVIYYYLKDYLPKGFWKRATYFADVLIATSFIFFTIPVFLLFNVPLVLLGAWFASGFVVLVAASIIIVKLIG